MISQCQSVTLPYLSLNSLTHINITADFLGITYSSSGTACNIVCIYFLLLPETDTSKENTLVRRVVMILFYFFLTIFSLFFFFFFHVKACLGSNISYNHHNIVTELDTRDGTCFISFLLQKM